MIFFFSSRRRHTRLTCDWSSDVCSSDLPTWVSWTSFASAEPSPRANSSESGARSSITSNTRPFPRRGPLKGTRPFPRRGPLKGTRPFSHRGPLRAALVALAVLPLVGGCSSLPSVHGISLGSASPSASQYQAEPARHEGGTLAVGDWESPTNFSPLFNEEVPAAQLDAMLFSGLVRLDPHLQPVPDLVERVPTLENGDVNWNRT